MSTEARRPSSAPRPRPPRRPTGWRRYAVPLALVVGVGALLAIVLASLSGGSSPSTPVRTAARTTTPARLLPAPRPVGGRQLAFHDSGLRLPTGLRAPASITLAAGQALLVGGINGAGRPVAAILRVTPTEVARVGRLGAPLTGAAGASVSGVAYVFGGGRVGGTAGTAGDGGGQPTANIERVDPSGNSEVVDQLPVAVSGAGAAVVGGTAYVVGGFDGRHAVASVMAWQPGVGGHIVASMPVGLRDPAVVAVGGQLVIAGGMTAKGPSKALYGFDPRTNQVTGIAPLPMGLAHAQAAVLHGHVYLIGGQASVQGSQTDEILEYDPVTAHIAGAGRLPTPLSDAGVATLGDQVVLAGGIDDAGRLHREVWLSG